MDSVDDRDDQGAGTLRTSSDAGALDPVEEILAHILERPEEEWQKAFRDACNLHPQNAAELRRRWELVAVLESQTAKDPSEGFPERLGDFRLLRRLGAGGMGVVYVAEQESLRRRVALKLIRPDQLFFPGARERFRREVEAAARLQHPGIVPVHLVGEERGIPYFAMEWVHGCTLADVLDEVRARTPAKLRGPDLRAAIVRATERATGEVVPAASHEVKSFEGGWAECCLRLLLKVSQALAHAHERGVQHRDVKPSNVLVTADGRALLLDFGLASSTEATPLTRTGSQIGSLPYMAPERIRDAATSSDPRSDVYSLGATFHELLTLRNPFLSATTDETRSRILQADATPVRVLNPSVPWDVETVCQVAMEKDPVRRYASAADLAADLKNLLEHRPIRARRPGALLRGRRFVERHPVASVALVFGGLLLWAVPFTWFIKERSDRRVIAEKLAEVQRLKDSKLLRDLLELDHELHPATPQMESALKSWLDEADRLLARRPIHERTLDRMREDLAAGLSEDRSAVQWEIDAIESILSSLDQVVTRRASVQSRQGHARSVEGRTRTGNEAREAWEEASFEISQAGAYGGLEIAPQLGLLPLGAESDSGLWEFWQVQSGERPQRDLDNGRWKIAAETGIVLVLIPGGRFSMGSRPPSAEHPVGNPNVDRRFRSTGDEGPVHEVELAPFFISKYEMTQGQWLRFTGNNPSDYHAGMVVLDRHRYDFTHPVESVDWTTASEVLRRLGLCLPTESQWEYACRAGTTTVFSHGDLPETMKEFGNILDLPFRATGLDQAEPWADGFYHHGPVGSLRPNAFGLFDMHGNVYEWCLDHWGRYDARPPRAGDGLRIVERETRQRIARGGAWSDPTVWARSASRYFKNEDVGDPSFGVRPARPLDL